MTERGLCEKVLFVFLENAYDSHVHWLMTGLRQTAISLHPLKSSRDAAHIKAQPNRGEWILGYGWDQNLWPNQELPLAQDLKHISNPVVFTRIDGHAVWVNDEALRRAGIKNSTGVLVDADMNPVMDLVPEPSKEEIRAALKFGVKHFNSRGFTHIRDLTCSTTQWEAATELESKGELTLAVEEYFDCLPYKKFETAFAEAKYCRKQKSKFLRVAGIKVFFDGALGSEGALIRCCYPSGKHGLQLMTVQELGEVAKQVWDEDLRLAVHIIGDKAAEMVIDQMLVLKKSGFTGGLDFEHCQLMSLETISKLRDLDVTIHMQPCHWLSDKRWLRTKLQDNRAELFPWSQIEETGKKIFFGSDSPIEPASISLNQKALDDASQQKIRPPKFSASHYQSHPDRKWVPNCRTQFSGEAAEVTFNSVLLRE